MHVILYPDSLAQDGLATERDEAAGRAEVVVYPGRARSDVPDADWARADALVTGLHMPIDEEIIDGLGQCRIITRLGVGYDLIDARAAGRRGIRVCNVPDYGTTEVADHAIALVLAFARGIVQFNERFIQTEDPVWDYSASPTVTRLAGRRLGVIGLGRIGTASAMRAKGFGLHVAAHDPYIPDGQELALGVERFHDLHAMLRVCDFVTVHCLASAETANLIDRAAVAAMKPGAVLVNTARGAIVDLDAVQWGLESGHLGGAGLDVFPEEPPPADHPLIRAWRAREEWVRDRLVITPHAAFYSAAGFDFLRRKALRTCLDFLEDGRLNNCVNTQHLAIR